MCVLFTGATKPASPQAASRLIQLICSNYRIGLQQYSQPTSDWECRDIILVYQGLYSGQHNLVLPPCLSALPPHPIGQERVVAPSEDFLVLRM